MVNCLIVLKRLSTQAAVYVCYRENGVAAMDDVGTLRISKEGTMNEWPGMQKNVLRFLVSIISSFLGIMLDYQDYYYFVNYFLTFLCYGVK